ncbi:MAG: branched-chain amino acid ABC transporter permease [Anaerotruncus sp.]|nr:branched-chain amino acid ABC transporter permease [Anaerotruncus sp.]
MGLFVLQIVNGLVIGMLYGLAALGFSMIFKALGYMNFAHADTIMIGAILYYLLISSLHFPPFVAFFAALILTIGYGVLTEKLIFVRFRKTSPITFMLVAMSLSTVVKNVTLMLYGFLPHGLDINYTDAYFMIGDTKISLNNFVILGISLVILLVLQLFFTKTKFGLSIRMAQDDPDMASVMGVNVLSTRAATFGIAAGLGCVAGMLMGPLFSISTELGTQISLKSFIAAVIGGLGNFVGAVAGGLIVGVVESLGATYISSGYKDAIVYIVGIIVLGFFPYGIFRRVATKH